MSRKPYECFRCRDNGFPNTQVYLAGKDEQGKTVYVEDNGTAHQHKIKQQQEQQQQESQGSTTVVTEPTAMKIINAKLDRIISLLESQKKQE
jgi:hypothetical protein